MPTKSEKQPLSVTHPELAAQAVGWDPSLVTPGSAKKMTWRCKENHMWDAAVYSRTGKSPGGCPYCSNQRVLSGYNDISTTHPEIAREAFGWDPSTVGSGSSKKLNWQCVLGHVYEASAENRTRGKTGCPVCSGNKVLAGFNDLASTHPELALQADGWDPTSVSFGSPLKRNWKCNKMHTWAMSPNGRTSKSGTDCPVCSNQTLLAGFNDLATTNPTLAAQAFEWDPHTVVAGSSKKMKWKCGSGHLWEATINSRNSMNLGCPYCSNKKVLAGFNDLASEFPEIALQADGWDPTKVSSGSGKMQTWTCQLGHKWKAAVASRTIRGWGCPFCSNQRLLKGFNDLATTHSAIAAEAVDWDTSSVTAGSEARKKWRCPLGHEYFSLVRDRARRETNCTICAGRNVLVGFNDLATTHPEIAAQAVDWDPRTVSQGSNKKFRWRCEIGHEWISVVTNRIRENSGCPYCKNKTLLTGFNDLETVRPDLAKEAVGWDPSQVVFGSNRKVLWRCENGHEWKTAVVTRTSGNQTGCPSCATSGFDPNEDGFLYFLFHPDWEMHQIGITNVPDVRLAIHRRKGWELLELRGPMDGLLTREWETSILKMLRMRGAELAPTAVAGKFDGYTEAWLARSFPASSLKELMEKVKDDEEQRNGVT